MKMTPREFHIYIDSYSKRREIEQKESIYQAYLISRWVWQKKVDIDKILKNAFAPTKSKKMTPEQMLAQVKALNALFGGEIKEIKEESAG